MGVAAETISTGGADVAAPGNTASRADCAASVTAGSDESSAIPTAATRNGLFEDAAAAGPISSVSFSSLFAGEADMRHGTAAALFVLRRSALEVGVRPVWDVEVVMLRYSAECVKKGGEDGKEVSMDSKRKCLLGLAEMSVVLCTRAVT